MDRDKFKAILERAIELEDSAKVEDRGYSEQDLDEAAKELGIRREFLEKAISEMTGVVDSFTVMGTPEEVRREFLLMVINNSAEMKLARTQNGSTPALEDPLAPVRVDLVRMGQQRLPADTYFQVSFKDDENGGTRVAWECKIASIQKQMGIIGWIMGLFMGSIGTVAGVTAGTILPAIPMFLIGGGLAYLFKVTGKSQGLYFEKEIASAMENFRTLMEIKSSSGVGQEIRDLRERIAKSRQPAKQTSGAAESSDSSRDTRS